MLRKLMIVSMNVIKQKITDAIPQFMWKLIEPG